MFGMGRHMKVMMLLAIIWASSLGFDDLVVEIDVNTGEQRTVPTAWSSEPLDLRGVKINNPGEVKNKNNKTGLFLYLL